MWFNLFWISLSSSLRNYAIFRHCSIDLAAILAKLRKCIEKSNTGLSLVRGVLEWVERRLVLEIVLRFEEPVELYCRILYGIRGMDNILLGTQ